MAYVSLIYHLIIFFFKCLFFLILSPFFLVWVYTKRLSYDIGFSQELKKYGLSQKDIRSLKKELLHFKDLMKMMRNDDTKTLSIKR